MITGLPLLVGYQRVSLTPGIIIAAGFWRFFCRDECRGEFIRRFRSAEGSGRFTA